MIDLEKDSSVDLQTQDIKDVSELIAEALQLGDDIENDEAKLKALPWGMIMEIENL